MSIRDVFIEKQRNDNRQFEPNAHIVSCRTIGVDTANSPAVASRPGWIWVIEYNADHAFQVYNAGVPDLVNIPVLVYKHPKPPFIRQARDVDWGGVLNLEWGDTVSDVGAHKAQHEWLDWNPGFDVVNVYPRSIVPLRTYAQAGKNVWVDYYRYRYNGTFIQFDGVLFDWSAYSNTSVLTTTFILIYLDLSTNSIDAVSTVVNSSEVGASPVGHWPSVPDNSVPSAIIMHNQQTTTVESMITDVRDMYVGEDWVARNPPRWSLEYDSRDQYLAPGISLADGVWTQLVWDNTYANIVQDTESGLNDATNSYTVVVGGDYMSTVCVELECIDYPLPSSEVVKTTVVLYLNGVITSQRVWYLYYILDGVYMQLVTYNYNVSVGDVIQVYVMLESTQTPLTMHYLLRWFGHRVA